MNDFDIEFEAPFSRIFYHSEYLGFKMKLSIKMRKSQKEISTIFKYSPKNLPRILPYVSKIGQITKIKAYYFNNQRLINIYKCLYFFI